MATTGNWKVNISAHISLTTLCNTSFPMFFGVRNTFLKSFLGFNYIFRVILPFDMVVFLLYTVTIQQFFGINISHGSVATYLRCGGIFDNHFIANFILNVLVKELWKSVHIWRRYGQKSSVLLFLTHGVYMMNVMLHHVSSPNSHVGWLICEGLVEYQYHLIMLFFQDHPFKYEDWRPSRIACFDSSWVTKIVPKFHVIQDKTLTGHCVACVKRKLRRTCETLIRKNVIMLHI